MARTIRKTISYEHSRGKEWKRLANKNHRSKAKQLLANYDDDTIFPILREVSCIYDWRDYRNVYFDSKTALKNEWWAKETWYRWIYK